MGSLFIKAGLFGGLFLRLNLGYLAALVGTAGWAGVVGHDFSMALGAGHQRWRGYRVVRIVDSGLGKASSSFW
jgi:hypothetical protein